MRIGVNARLLLDGPMEGIARYATETLQRMINVHPEDDFILFFDRENHSKAINGPNVHWVVISPPARHPLLWHIWFEWRLPVTIRKHQVEVFYSPEAYLSMTTSVPSLMVVHDLAVYHYPDHFKTFHRRYFLNNLPRFMKKASSIVAVSHATKKDILTQTDLDADQVVIAGNGPTPDIFGLAEREQEKCRERWTEGKRYFIYVGSIHPRKNVDRLIQAFDLFRAENASAEHQLVIVGRAGWMIESVEQAYQNAFFRESIHWLGSQDEVSELISSADALVYVSLFEGFGIPILEGFAAGVPVITSDRSSMAEVAGDAAYFVDPTSLESIALGMKKVTFEGQIAQSLVEKGRIRLQEYSWDKTAAIIYQELRRIAGKS